MHNDTHEELWSFLIEKTIIGWLRLEAGLSTGSIEERLFYDIGWEINFNDLFDREQLYEDIQQFVLTQAASPDPQDHLSSIIAKYNRTTSKWHLITSDIFDTLCKMDARFMALRMLYI